jgi:hypothetical protein
MVKSKNLSWNENFHFHIFDRVGHPHLFRAREAKKKRGSAKKSESAERERKLKARKYKREKTRSAKARTQKREI